MNPAESALERPTGWIERPGRLRIDVTGPDRAKFLNNLTTNDFRRLEVGSGREAFVTNLQGKTLGFVTILAAEDRQILRTEAEAKEFLDPHFRKYGALDDVEFEDATASTFEIVLIGPGAAERLGLDRDATDLSHRSGVIGGRDVRIVRDDPTGRGALTILGRREDVEAVRSAIGEFGPEIGVGAFEAMRIEAGTPAFGKDVTAENLPQEIGRDARAISFVKGCYLGQETVARIDALGHVNKILRGLRIEGAIAPPPGTPLDWEGKAVGKVTSSAASGASGSPVALAMIRVLAAEPGTRVSLETATGRLAATVAELPMISGD